jgi:hypothetical protein
MRALAEAIVSEVTRAAGTLRRLSEADAVRPRGDGKWVKKQIVGHLIDSAVNNHQRFVRAQFSNPFVWPGYDQVAWVQLQRYEERPWTELVDLWVALNRHVSSVIASVPVEKLATPCVIGDREPWSLEWWMRDYLRHLRHHLVQLEVA